MSKQINHLLELESESIHLIRECAAQFQKPAILFSGGKDSIVVLHLAMKAFLPAKMPFPLIHIDTGHNFDETLSFRDRLIERYSLQLIEGSVQEAIQSGKVKEDPASHAGRNLLQIPILLDTLEKNHIDVAIGGARRDEEKSRAKERFLSHRDAFGQWDPKNQRPELWSNYNGKKRADEHFRAFPLSNWTELDVWEYIRLNQIELPSIYFAHDRLVFSKNGQLLAFHKHIFPQYAEQSKIMKVRCRTIGDISSTGLWPSDASTVDDIISELKNNRYSERGSRLDDHQSSSAMEDRKREGYF